MSTLGDFFTASHKSNSEIIGTSRGPNDTLIVTYSDQVAVFPTIGQQTDEFKSPVAVYDLNQANNSGLTSQTPTQKVSRFTSPAQYHQSSEQFVLVADNTIVMTWPTFANAGPYDGARWSIFCPDFLAQSKSRIYNIYPNPIDPDSILVVDTWGRLFNFPVPSRETPLPPQLIKPRSEIITALKAQSKAISKADQPIIFWAGPITNQYFLVATETGLICYSTTTLQIVHEIVYPYAQQTAQAGSDPLRSPPGIVAQTVCSVSSIRVEGRVNSPRFFNSAIPQAVVYQNGHIEVFNFNITLKHFELCYSRSLSPQFVSPQTHVHVLSPQHVMIVTPSRAGESSQLKSSALILELAYYTVSTSRTFSKALPPFPLYGQNDQILFPNAFQIDTSRATSTTVIEIAKNKLHVFKSRLELPTLASSIGSATRDAEIWNGVALVSKKATLQTASSSSSDQSAAKTTRSQQTVAAANQVSHYQLELSAPYILDESKHIICHFQIPSIAFPISTTAPHTTPSSFVQLDLKRAVTTKDINSDAILALSNQTLPILAPFSSHSPSVSFSNQLSNSQPPTDLLMKTATLSTAPLDQIIITNWPVYLAQCDDVERNALKRMLPRLYPYLNVTPSSFTPASSTSTTTTQSKKRALSGQPRTTVPSTEISELPADDFLYQFFSHCAAWSQSTPTLLSTLSPLSTATTLQETLQTAPKCQCCLNTTSPTTNSTSLQQFVSSLVFEPCAWKALHSSTLSLTGTSTSSHLSRSSLLYNTHSAQTHPQLASAVTSSPTFTFCENAVKLSFAKPLSPLFTHLLFRECLRHLESACCSNCPQMLYLLPLHILISNSMLNSALAITCVNVAVKRGYWGLINAILPMSNISHSAIFLNVITAVLQDFCHKFIESESDGDHAVKSAQIKLVDIDDELNEDDELQPPPKSKSAKTAKQKPTPQDANKDSVVDVLDMRDCITAAAPRTDFAGFCNNSVCSCHTPALFSSQPEPTHFSIRFPHVSDFIAHSFTQESSACVIYTLLASPLTQPILIHQLRELDITNVLTLLNILALIFQSIVSGDALPPWLSCNECSQLVTGEHLLVWITMLIDSHAKEIMMTPHLFPQSQWKPLNVFATLHNLVTNYVSVRPEMLHSASGMSEQLSKLKSRGITKLSVAEPYTIQFTKF